MAHIIFPLDYAACGNFQKLEANCLSLSKCGITLNILNKCMSACVMAISRESHRIAFLDLQFECFFLFYDVPQKSFLLEPKLLPLGSLRCTFLSPNLQVNPTESQNISGYFPDRTSASLLIYQSRSLVEIQVAS